MPCLMLVCGKCEPDRQKFPEESIVYHAAAAPHQMMATPCSLTIYPLRRPECGAQRCRHTSLPSTLTHPCRLRLLTTRCSKSHPGGVDVEVEAAAASPPVPTGDTRPMMSTIQTHNPGDDRLFKVLLAVITKLWSSPDQLERFILSRPEPTSMPFLMWLADQEAQATGQQQALLAALCELLVVRRERQDRERMEELYLDTLELLTSPGAGEASAAADAGLPLPEDSSQKHASTSASTSGSLEPSMSQTGCSGEGGPEAPGPSAQQEEHAEASGLEAGGPADERQQQAMQLQSQRQQKAIALLSSSPELYAAQLAEKLTGVSATVDGYGPVYDLLLKAAPPAALTEQGIKKAHADAEELAADMKQRRKRSVAALIGRAKLTAEQADRLKAGSPATRILDMLLTAVSTNEERAACLGDCFTPPEQHVAAGEGQQDEQTTEELWCTPAQLLSELEVRIRGMSGAAAPGGAVAAAPQLLASKSQMSGPELLDSLQQLRVAVMAHLMNAMEQ